ncbi:MAG TPA: DUF2007 domain-containing protein [Gemmatimonadales bacterium]|jgi:hypothetical protein
MTITVFTSSDPAEVIVAKLLLDAAGIPYVAAGEGVQDLIGYGRAFGGFNPITGPVQIRVAEENVEAAVDTLRDVRDGADD